MAEILVAISGDGATHPALDWAMSFAERTRQSVELVHVVDVTWGIVPADYTERALLEAEQALRDQERAAMERHPGVAIRSTVLVGSPVEELARASAAAEWLVIGGHRHGSDGTAGRTTVRIAARAECSVIVVPDDIPATAVGFVVGVDGSDDGAAAVQFAAREADRFGEPLTVLYSWTAPEPWSATASILWPTIPIDEDRLIVAEASAGVRQDYPDLELLSEVVSARPERALAAASVNARMLVLGSRGRHALTRLLLGSVSESMVSALPCTVAVLRPQLPTASD